MTFQRLTLSLSASRCVIQEILAGHVDKAFYPSFNRHIATDDLALSTVNRCLRLLEFPIRTTTCNAPESISANAAVVLCARSALIIGHRAAGGMSGRTTSANDAVDNDIYAPARDSLACAPPEVARYCRYINIRSATVVSDLH